jgi:hypothetical protein
LHDPSRTSATSGLPQQQASSIAQPSLQSSTRRHEGEAAIAGGAGASGLGAYEAKKHHDEKHSLPPTQSQGHTAGANAPGATGTAPGEAFGSSSTNPQDQHHYGRDAALAGGAGATGLGAYEAKKHHDDKKHEPVGQTATAGSQNPTHYGTDRAIGVGSAIPASSALGHERDQRPGQSTDMASNASIKSGVLGQAPTGSSMTHGNRDENTPLPNVPSTGGRFMEDGLTNQSQRSVFARKFIF